MNEEQRSLNDCVWKIIENAGFPEDMYVFKDMADEIYVEFDDKPSADYLIYVAKEPEWDNLAVSHSLNGKRHRVTFFLW